MRDRVCCLWRSDICAPQNKSFSLGPIFFLASFSSHLSAMLEHQVESSSLLGEQKLLIWKRGKSSGDELAKRLKLTGRIGKKICGRTKMKNCYMWEKLTCC